MEIHKVDSKIVTNGIKDFDFAVPLMGDTITFSETCLDYCVGIVDIVNSTKITASLPSSKVGKYYSIFLNTMSSVAKKFGAVIVKNIGDSLLYYFPDTLDPMRKYGFMKSLECCLAMVDSHHDINTILHAEKLPSLDYRVSADYGRTSLAKSSVSVDLDIFGPPVNMVAKINHMAAPNTVVIGDDLHRIVKELYDYKFVELMGYSVGFKYQYTIYSVSRRF